MTQQNLPYRFRETAFREKEYAITAILLAFPNVVVFAPPNVETFSCRLRDAMKSLSENNWEYLHATNFHEKYPQIQVSIRGSTVLVGSRSAIKAYGRTEVPMSSAPAPALVPVDPHHPLHLENIDQRGLESLLYLHHSRLLTTPTRLRFNDPKWFLTKLDFYQENYDIAIERVNDTDFTVL